MRDLIKFLYTHNPFYLLSVCFILYGLKLAFGTISGDGRVDAVNEWYLAGSLAIYCLVLASTAVAIVRVISVWEDARTIALLLILLFVSISASFDDLVIQSRETAIVFLLVGLGFAVFLTEVVLWGIRLKLSLVFRIPFYLSLALFFLFPLSIRHAWWEYYEISIPGRIFLFSCVAGVITLTLIPAVRYGRCLLANNGSPWVWPFYPWSIFIFFAMGVLARSYTLTLAFQDDRGLESSFGTYYWVPFALGVLVLLSEMAIVERSRILERVVLGGIVLMVAIAIPLGESTPYRLFLYQFKSSVASPIWLALWLAIGMIGYVAIRGFGHWNLVGISLLIAATFVGPETMQFNELKIHSIAPVMIASGLMFYNFVRSRQSISMVAGLVFALIAVSYTYPEIALTKLGLVAVVHVGWMTTIAVCYLCRDAFALWVRRISPWMCGATLIAVFVISTKGYIRSIDVFGYGCFQAIIGSGIWMFTHEKAWKVLAISVATVTPTAFVLTNATNLFLRLPLEARYTIAVGAGCFVAGVAVSLAKGRTLGFSTVDN